MFNQNFEENIEEVFFKCNRIKEIKVNPNKSTLLDNCSTMDLFCNSDIVENITKTENKVTVQGNGGTLVVTHKEIVSGYKQYVFFIKYSITNVIALKNMIKQY